MRSGALGLLVAAAIALIGLSIPGAAAAGQANGSAGAPNSLTRHFPLGSQTLSHTTAASAGGSAARPTASATTPHRASTATPRRGTAPVGHKPGGGGSSWLLLLAIPVLIVVALLSRVAIHRSRRSVGPDALVTRQPVRFKRSAGRGARWTDQDSDEPEHRPPPLPIRPRAK